MHGVVKQDDAEWTPTTAARSLGLELGASSDRVREAARRAEDRALIVGDAAAARRAVAARELLLGRPARFPDCRTRGLGTPALSCRHHLFLEVLPSGEVRLTFPEREPHELPETCALRVATREGVRDACPGGHLPLSTIGALLNITPERARQLEAAGLKRLRARDDVREAGKEAGVYGIPRLFAPRAPPSRLGPDGVALPGCATPGCQNPRATARPRRSTAPELRDLCRKCRQAVYDRRRSRRRRDRRRGAR
jgi:hypothetical protein